MPWHCRIASQKNKRRPDGSGFQQCADRALGNAFFGALGIPTSPQWPQCSFRSQGQFPRVVGSTQRFLRPVPYPKGKLYI